MAKEKKSKRSIKTKPSPVIVGDCVTHAHAGNNAMLGTVQSLRFGKLGEGQRNIWIAKVQWHGRFPSIARHAVARLIKCKR